MREIRSNELPVAFVNGGSGSHFLLAFNFGSDYVYPMDEDYHALYHDILYDVSFVGSVRSILSGPPTCTSQGVRSDFGYHGQHIIAVDGSVRGNIVEYDTVGQISYYPNVGNICYLENEKQLAIFIGTNIGMQFLFTGYPPVQNYGWALLPKRGARGARPIVMCVPEPTSEPTSEPHLPMARYIDI